MNLRKMLKSSIKIKSQPAPLAHAVQPAMAYTQSPWDICAGVAEDQLDMDGWLIGFLTEPGSIGDGRGGYFHRPTYLWHCAGRWKTSSQFVLVLGKRVFKRLAVMPEHNELARRPAGTGLLRMRGRQAERVGKQHRLALAGWPTPRF